VKTTTPEVLNAAMELLADYIKLIELNQLPTIYYENNPVIKIKQNIKHLKLMRIFEEYRLKQ
jgi:hypothetical protein